MSPLLAPVKWTLIEPAEAVGLDLRSDKDIVGPLNSLGQLCPWPWGMQQDVFDPGRTHVCRYCGQEGTPGLEHPDFRDMLDDFDEQ